MAKKRMVIILFLEEAEEGTGVFQLEDQIINGYTPFVEKLDKYLSKITAEYFRKLVQ